MSDNPWESLTEKQRRRVKLWLRGLTYRQIAEVEKVDHTSIRDSLWGVFQKIPSIKSMGYDGRAH